MNMADDKIKDGAPALPAAQISDHLAQLPGWQISDDGKAIRREWQFKSFKRAAELASIAAWQAEVANHHPDIAFGWGHASVTYSTHSAGGVTLNDLIMAARLNRAVAGG